MVPAQCEPSFDFRCRVTLVDKQQCQLGYSCDAVGNRLSGRLKKRTATDENSRSKRQAGEEFFADGPPQCRTELSPLGCTPVFRSTSR